MGFFKRAFKRLKKNLGRLFGISSWRKGSTLAPIAAPQPPGTIEFALAESIWLEGGLASVMVRRINGAAGAVGCGFSMAVDTGLPGQDYVNTFGNVLWPAGDTTPKQILVQTLATPGRDGVRRFYVNLSGPVGGAKLGAQVTHSIRIFDQGATPVGPARLIFEASSYQIDETGVSVTLRVWRVGSLAGEIDVDYDAVDDTALAGTHYDDVTGSLHWDADEADAKEITVPITDNATADGDKRFLVRLSNCVGAVLSEAGDVVQLDAEVIIIDDESIDPGATGQLNFIAIIINVAEGQTALLYVSRTGGSLGAASVEYETVDGTAIEDEHYTPTSGFLNWGNGEVGWKFLNVVALDDPQMNPTRQLTVELFNPVGAAIGLNDVATINILDNDRVTRLLRKGPSVFEGRMLRVLGESTEYLARRVCRRPIGVYISDIVGPPQAHSIHGGSGNVITDGTGLTPTLPWRTRVLEVSA